MSSKLCSLEFWNRAPAQRKRSTLERVFNLGTNMKKVQIHHYPSISFGKRWRSFLQVVVSFQQLNKKSCDNASFVKERKSIMDDA